MASVGGPQQLGGPGQWPVWPVVKTALLNMATVYSPSQLHAAHRSITLSMTSNPAHLQIASPVTLTKGATMLGFLAIYSVSKKRTNFETVQLEIIRIDSDDICQTMFVTPKVIAIFYPNLKLTILTLHFITISSVSCTIFFLCTCL